MIIVPKSFKAPPLASENWRGQHQSQLALFFLAGDMKPCSGHKETPVEGRTCQQSRNFKKMLCVFQLRKKNHPTWPLETFNPPGNKTISIMKRKIIDAKVPSGRGYMLVHVSSKAVLGKWQFHQTSFKKKGCLGFQECFFKCFFQTAVCPKSHDKRPRWDRIPRVRSGFQIWSLTLVDYPSRTLSNGVTRLAPCSPDKWH